MNENKGSSLRLFTPRHLADQETLGSLSILSGGYFQVANEFRAMAATENSQWPGHFYVCPAVTMYTAAFEAFLQEHLALSRVLIESPDDVVKLGYIERIKALKGEQSRDFKQWVKEVFRLYDPTGVGLDTKCDEYQNLIALKEVRNALIHYNPEFIEYAMWPDRLQQALQRSKLDVMNAGWVTNFRQVGVADWAHDTIRAAVELFCRMSGAENPFTTTKEGGMTNWEYVRSNPASQPPPASQEEARTV